MPVFYEVTTDIFKERFDELNSSGTRSRRAGVPSVRRPLRGLEIKEDTYAVLKVIDLVGREIPLYDSGSKSGKSTMWTNFILQSVVEQRQEKQQVVETFGDPYIFFFGENPRFLQCSAILVNSLDFNWQAEFWENYEENFRGTRCAEQGARVYMFYDDKVVEGYMLMAKAVNDGMNPLAVRLDFQLFLTNYRNVSLIGDPNYPIRLGVDVEVSNSSDGTLVEGSRATRSLIHDNWDEWTAEQPVDQEVPDYEEVEDLIKAAVDEAAKNAAQMNTADSIAESGLSEGSRNYTQPSPKGKDRPALPGPPPCEEGTIQSQGDNCTCEDANGTRINFNCNQIPGEAPSLSGLSGDCIDVTTNIAGDRVCRDTGEILPTGNEPISLGTDETGGSVDDDDIAPGDLDDGTHTSGVAPNPPSGAKWICLRTTAQAGCVECEQRVYRNNGGLKEVLSKQVGEACKNLVG